MSPFTVTTHTISASHFRENARGLNNAYHDVPNLKLVVNRYVPKNRVAQPGDVSIIFAHANGFHKELYEAFFADLLVRYPNIRGIWAPDAAHQGASGILNEPFLGDQPCWTDFARDIVHLINVFASELPPPLVGVGHSFGGHAIVRASLTNPSLFAAMVLIDPVIEEWAGHGLVPAKASSKRQDCWPSRQDAEKYFRSRTFYKQWDPRCLEAHLKHGLRDLPTLAYPDKAGVTLTTSKFQEVCTFLLCEGEERVGNHVAPADTFRKLKELTRPVLYIVGGDSPVSPEWVNKRKLENTPNAEMVSVPDVGHLIPMEKPAETAEIAARYIHKQITAWNAAAEEDQRTPRQKAFTPAFLKAIAKL